MKELTVNELKIAAFDIDQQIKRLQLEYRAVMEELQRKLEAQRVKTVPAKDSDE